MKFLTILLSISIAGAASMRAMERPEPAKRMKHVSAQDLCAAFKKYCADLGWIMSVDDKSEENLEMALSNISLESRKLIITFFNDLIAAELPNTDTLDYNRAVWNFYRNNSTFPGTFSNDCDYLGLDRLAVLPEINPESRSLIIRFLDELGSRNFPRFTHKKFYHALESFYRIEVALPATFSQDCSYLDLKCLSEVTIKRHIAANSFVILPKELLKITAHEFPWTSFGQVAYNQLGFMSEAAQAMARLMWAAWHETDLRDFYIEMIRRIRKANAAEEINLLEIAISQFVNEENSIDHPLISYLLCHMAHRIISGRFNETVFIQALESMKPKIQGIILINAELLASKYGKPWFQLRKYCMQMR